MPGCAGRRAERSGFQFSVPTSLGQPIHSADNTGSKLFDENLLLIKQIGLDNSGAINQAG
jgi:hypothetical protein